MYVKTLSICRALWLFQCIFVKEYSSVWSQRKKTFHTGENDDVNSNFKIKTINFIPNTAAWRIIVQCCRLSLQSKRSCTCILRCKRWYWSMSSCNLRQWNGQRVGASQLFSRWRPRSIPVQKNGCFKTPLALNRLTTFKVNEKGFLYKDS